jgi:hypothetical protein
VPPPLRRKHSTWDDLPAVPVRPCLAVLGNLSPLQPCGRLFEVGRMPRNRRGAIIGATGLRRNENENASIAVFCKRGARDR